MSDRRLTLVVSFPRNSAPAWIWDAHIHPDLAKYGMNVEAIAEGNQLRLEPTNEDEDDE